MSNYKIYEVDMVFKQMTGATMPITATSEEEAKKIAEDLFKDYDNLEVKQVRDLGFQDMANPEGTVGAPQSSSILIN